MTLYPNPASALVTLSVPVDVGSYLIELIDTRGAVVYSKNHRAHTATIDTAQLPRGLYLVKATTTNKVLTTRLVLQ